MANILIVDDDQTTLDLLRRGLEADGHSLVASGDGQDAFDAWSGDPTRYDLIVTDVSMPGLDGIAFLGKVMAVRPGMPAILMSGLADELTRARALADGHGVRLISKPVALETLRAEIAALLS